MKLTKEIVKDISSIKNEEDWMLDFRLKCYRHFAKMPLPSFGPDLSFLNYDDYTYLQLFQ